MDVFTNMNTYPCMSTTDGNNDWCRDMDNSSYCKHSVQNAKDHLTPAYRYVRASPQRVCAPALM